MLAHPLIRFFAPDPRHHGVRPAQIWGLRLFFLLMLVFVHSSHQMHGAYC